MGREGKGIPLAFTNVEEQLYCFKSTSLEPIHRTAVAVDVIGMKVRSPRTTYSCSKLKKGQEGKNEDPRSKKRRRELLKSSPS